MLTADASRDTPPAEAPHCIRGTAAKKLHQYLARRITTEDDERARTSGLHQPREGDRERADIGDAVQSCEIREAAIEGRQATRMRALSEGAQRLQHGLLYGYVAVAGRAKLGCGELDHARCPVGHHQLVTALEEEACVVPGSAAQLEQAVDSFLTGSGDVVDATRRIRDDALVLREANEQDPMLDVVERLALAGEDDPAALALARQLATPGVCAGLAMRLAGARDEERRATLVQVCHRLGEEAAGAVARALAEADGCSERKNLVAALAGLGEQGLRQAEVMVQDGTWQVVRNGVSILSELGGDRVVEHLVGTLAHHHPKVRRETIQALARIGGETSTLLVINKLDDPDADVRATAARAIGTLGSERSVRNLLERLDQESVGEVQQEILRALGQIGDPGAVPAIEKRAVGGFLKRPPAEVRVAAYRALALIGTPHAKKVLNDATDDKDMDVRAAARSLLGLS